MELSKLTSKAVWNGVKIDLPVNHELEKYSEPSLGDPMALVQSIEHVPDTEREDYELDLFFRVQSLIPYGYMGELHSDYFVHIRDLKILEAREDGVLVEFIGQSVCNVVEMDYDPNRHDPFHTSWCGIARQYLEDNPGADKLKGDEREEVGEEISDSHACGLINDGVIILFGAESGALTVNYDSTEEDMLYGTGKTKFSELSEDEIKEFTDQNWGDECFLEPVTAPDGKKYSLLYAGHED